MIITEDYNPTWLMLQTTTEGKKTSERGTVMVSTVVTTVAFMKSMVLLQRNIAAQPMATQTMIDQKICLKPDRVEKYFLIFKIFPLTCPEAVCLGSLGDVLPPMKTGLVTKRLNKEKQSEKQEGHRKFTIMEQARLNTTETFPTS